MNTRYYGYEFHKKDTMQDAGFKRFVENHIMEMYGIPLLRFKTNGSGEKEKNIEVLEKVAV